MRKLGIIFITLCLLCACSRNTASTETVYRVLKDEYQTNGQLIVEVEIPANYDQSSVQTVMDALSNVAEDDRTYNPLWGTDILGIEIEGGTAKVSIAEGYIVFSEMTKTLVNACLTLSLCQLPEIDRISIEVAGDIVAEDMTASDMLLFSDELSTEQEICIYFANEEGTLLIPEYRKLSLSDDAQIERYVMEELLREPSNSSLKSPIAAGTTLLGVSHSGQTCTVNLSQEFLDNKPKTATEEVLSIYSIVNSLTSLSNVSDVIITVEGQNVYEYLNLSLESPLERLELISLKSNETSVETRLYFGYKDAIFGVPCLVSSEDNITQAVLDKLSTAESFGCYESLFTEDDELTFTENSHGVCKITISRSFLERRSSSDSALALDALIRTLVELEGVTAIKITYADGTVPLAPYRDLTEVQRVVTAEIIQ